MQNINLSHRQKGDIGEEMAEKFLNQKGYQTIVKNYCIKGGEIDLIMKDKDETVFVEVKTRYSRSKFGEAAENISMQKLQYIQKAIEKFFADQNKNFYTQKFRIDAVLIQMDAPKEHQIQHIENAFSFDDFFDTMW